MKFYAIEEAIRALNELEVRTVVLSEVKGHNKLELTMVHIPRRISQPLTYVVRWARASGDETIETNKKEFSNFRAAVDHYNKLAQEL